MEIIRVPRVMQDTIRGHRIRGRSVGFVPTMGALHAGHMQLVRTSRMENHLTVASIFVNPAQFGPGEDLERYPCEPESDIGKLTAAGADFLFMPDEGHMYPKGFSTKVDVGELSTKLCGAFRTGHFNAVATVATKLFNIAFPTRAYFGQKDYQQFLVIKRLAQDLNKPVEVVMCPTAREEDGLALSSRNKYLSPDERRAAAVIYRALEAGAGLVRAGGAEPREVSARMKDALESEPLVAEVQYAGAYDPESLEELSGFKSKILLAAAVKIGQTRLIDNVIVENPQMP